MGWSCFKFNNLCGRVKSVEKGLKIKVRTFWGLTFTFAEVIEEKLVEGGEGFLPPPLLHPS